jgi:ADP-heptose:LPS heptosyltransferase
LFDSFGPKPKIGICWSGGSKHNKPKERAIGLEAMRGLIESIDADWISLQYKDPTAEIKEFGLPIRHYKRACETDDYDDTAAMVAELDMVIGVHTTAHHLAGALGVPGIILVPSRTIWIYCLPDGSMPWYRSASLFKQREGESWKSTIERLINDPLVCGFRPEGSRGVSRLLPVSDQPLVKSCGVSPAGAVAVA